MGKLLKFLIINFMNVLLCFRFCLLCSKLELLGTICEKSHIMKQFTPSEIWKPHAELLVIHTKSSNMNISKCLSVNLKTMQRIQKELDESTGDYEGTAAQKPHSNCSDKKELLHLLLRSRA